MQITDHLQEIKIALLIESCLDSYKVEDIENKLVKGYIIYGIIDMVNYQRFIVNFLKYQFSPIYHFYISIPKGKELIKYTRCNSIVLLRIALIL